MSVGSGFFGDTEIVLAIGYFWPKHRDRDGCGNL